MDAASHIREPACQGTTFPARSATATRGQGMNQVRRWRAFAVLAVSFFMTVVDLAIVNVALPTIGRKLHMPETSLQWVVTGYALTFGGFLLLGGRAADLLGRRRMLIGASGATVGIIAGGLLTRYVGWQYIFFLHVPIGAAALLLAPRMVPESRLATARRRYDPFGAVAVTGGLSLLVSVPRSPSSRSRSPPWPESPSTRPAWPPASSTPPSSSAERSASP